LTLKSKYLKLPSIYIVEDEPLIAATIETMLLKQGFEVIGDAESAEVALKQIETLKPDLVLVDIMLEGNKDGIDLALALEVLGNPYVYLTSQTDPNTIERVKKTSPLGFVAKPFTEAGLRSNLDLAWFNYKNTNSYFLTIKSDGRIININQNTITHLKAFDNYCYVYTVSKTYLVPHTLKYMAEQLNPETFVKTHRSFWVNLKHIDAIDKNQLILKTEPIPLSSSHKAIVVSRLKEL
jgi:DNA-binding LytR/AlgR family response regulator